MSIPCELMTGEELLKKMKKEFSYPYDWLSGLRYSVVSNYGKSVVVKCVTVDGTQVAEGGLATKNGCRVSYGQFNLFLEKLIILPNYNRLELEFGEKGVLLATVCTFPMKVV